MKRDGERKTLHCPNPGERLSCEFVCVCVKYDIVTDTCLQATPGHARHARETSTDCYWHTDMCMLAHASQRIDGGVIDTLYIYLSCEIVCKTLLKVTISISYAHIVCLRGIQEEFRGNHEWNLSRLFLLLLFQHTHSLIQHLLFLAFWLFLPPSLPTSFPGGPQKQ